MRNSMDVKKADKHRTAPELPPAPTMPEVTTGDSGFSAGTMQKARPVDACMQMEKQRSNANTYPVAPYPVFIRGEAQKCSRQCFDAKKCMKQWLCSSECIKHCFCQSSV